MSNSIYEEAIADAKALKEAAEERAKQKLVEAMTPRIKILVENNLLENEEDDQIDDNNDQNSVEDKSDSDEESGNTDDSLEGDKDLNTENYTINNESISALKNLMTSNLKKSIVENKLLEIKRNVSKIKKAVLISEGSDIGTERLGRLDNIIKKIISEINSLKDNSIINSDTNLLETYLNINKELKAMSRRRRNKRNYLNESLDDLLEMNIFEDDDMPELEDNADDDMSELEDNADDSESISKDDIEKAFKGFADEFDLDLGISDDDEGDEYELSDDDEGDDSDLEDLEDLEGLEADDTEDGDLDVDDEDVDGDEREDESLDLEGEVLEIDENMLRREIGKMKRLREGDAAAMAGHFGGGSLDKEMFVDVDDGLLNALADQVGDAPTPTLKKEVALRKNAQRKNRLMQKQLKESKSALRSMKKQLNEMNLFNAKLLYANKLMQNRDLSIKQQKHIVESLDNASTLNEAKLLFESLSKSLTKSRKGRNLNESASRRILGSSRSVSSSQSVKGNTDLDRWAKLAGIKK